eukprot:359009-Chlamydomonas_euryale.AAC.9
MALQRAAWRCNAAWLCMAPHGSAMHCMALHAAAWCRMALHGAAWLCMAPHGSAWRCMVLHAAAWCRMAQHMRCPFPNAPHKTRTSSKALTTTKPSRKHATRSHIHTSTCARMQRGSQHQRQGPCRSRRRGRRPPQRPRQPAARCAAAGLCGAHACGSGRRQPRHGPAADARSDGVTWRLALPQGDGGRGGRL